MRLHDYIIIFACILLAAGLIVAAGSQLDRINSQRQDMKIVIDKPENLPPSLVFATVATGAFRGLLVDFLWIRADKLKSSGQFFDAKQLAEWITILQPRFATVWQFQAWNMAYNISVAIPETQPQQRWRWVKNGYELLRDEAITKYKLNDIGIYHELARIFQHKIGSNSDDAHKYYKYQLATQIQSLLSSVDAQPQLSVGDNNYFDMLAEAPVFWREVLADPNIFQFVNELKVADTSFTNEDDFAANYLSLRQNSGRYNENAAKVIDKFRGSDTLRKFDIFAKAYQLRNVWKLDPVLMRKINKLYGPVEWNDPNSTHLPMDWRNADSHAIYWAEKGLEIVTKDSKRDITADETNTDRIVIHSLQNLFRMGKIIILPVKVTVKDPEKGLQTVEAKEVFLRPDLRFFKSYNDAILKEIDKYSSDPNLGAYYTMRDGHRNMLKNSVLLFYQSGHREQAQKLYDDLKKRYPMPEFEVPLKEFAKNQLLEDLKTFGINEAREQITAILKQGYYFYSIRDDDAAFGSNSDAKDLYDYYISRDMGERVSLPSFDQMKYMAMQDFRNDTQYPEYIRVNLFLGRLAIDNPDAYNELMAQEKKTREKTE
jgi:hypothetical protein